jgi:hypothetical protein
MKYVKTILFASLICLGTAADALAAELGTRAEAEGLLKRAVAVLKADTNRALDMLTSGDGGFIKKDLYVWCGGPDGMLTAHPHFMGAALKRWKDKTGKAVGEEIYASAADGKFSEIAYKAPRPKVASAAVTADAAEQVDKVSFFTKVGDNICGVGYYK